MRNRCALLLLLSCVLSIHAFQSPIGLWKRSAEDETKRASSPASIPDMSRLHVVLFGVGDLRVDDHLGLYNALNDSLPGSILPLLVLSDDTLQNIPGVVAHTRDTAHMLVAAVADVNHNLQSTLGASLQIASGATLVETLESILASYDDSDITVHACDLGPVDNELGYGTWSALMKSPLKGYDVKLWSNSLRDEPWSQVGSLPDYFPDYERQYIKDSLPKLPMEVVETTDAAAKSFVQISCPSMPTGQDLTARLTALLGLESARVEAEVCSGIFGSHWGGMPAKTIGSASVLDVLKAYTEDCQEQDSVWSRHPLFNLQKCKANDKSLEHASMAWQLRGDGVDEFGKLDTNWLAGESMVRYLAAPLLFGTVSSRRIWHMSTGGSMFFQSPMQTLVESREWHSLLAARNMVEDEAYQGIGRTVYKYWRYQGFLCRYAETKMRGEETEGALLVHGFGASATQWNKLMHALSDDAETISQGLAPDLIGFGQAEKPAISYTGYMWDSQVLDFVKEVAVYKNGWQTYIVGGNSIGGFTSLQLAACDTATVEAQPVTSSGAPGSNRCSGLVLMNSAGPLLSRDEIEMARRSASATTQSVSIAQATIQKSITPCKPPSRPLARAIGGILLTYLRPRIQSICTNLYPTNPSAVDNELCDNIRRDSLDPGAINVMMAGAKLPPPRTANELLYANFGYGCCEDSLVQESTFTGPVLVAQGVLDPLNDATDRMKRFGSLREGVTMDPINAGHCPHDELPVEVGRVIANWMSTTLIDRNAFIGSSTVAVRR